MEIKDRNIKGSAGVGMVDYVFLDLDGTILDYPKAEQYAFRNMSKKLGLPCTREHEACFSDICSKVWSEYADGWIPYDDLPKQVYGRYFAAIGRSGIDVLYADRVSKQFLSQASFALPGAEDFVRTCAGLVRIIVTTNGHADVQRSRVAHSPFAPYLKTVYASEAVGFPKPDPRFFEKVLKSECITDKSKVIVFGDSLDTDIKGAENAGLLSFQYREQADYMRFLEYLLRDL